MKTTNEMPAVTRCSVTECAYNRDTNCHARAITVGDTVTPGCDTYFSNQQHNKETRRIAGVGACKVSACKFNDDFECSAEAITVGQNGNEVRCLTFTSKP